jgi:hypothetical protein
MLVWAIHVTLCQRWIREQEYCIEVMCTGRGQFSFKAYDAKSHAIALGLASELYFAEDQIVSHGVVIVEECNIPIEVLDASSRYSLLLDL